MSVDRRPRAVLCKYRRTGYEIRVLTCKRERGEVVQFKVGA